jgi:hypothetical protein
MVAKLAPVTPPAGKQLKADTRVLVTSLARTSGLPAARKLLELLDGVSAARAADVVAAALGVSSSERLAVLLAVEPRDRVRAALALVHAAQDTVQVGARTCGWFAELHGVLWVVCVMCMGGCVGQGLGQGSCIQAGTGYQRMSACGAALCTPCSAGYSAPQQPLPLAGQLAQHHSAHHRLAVMAPSHTPAYLPPTWPPHTHLPPFPQHGPLTHTCLPSPNRPPSAAQA